MQGYKKWYINNELIQNKLFLNLFNVFKSPGLMIALYDMCDQQDVCKDQNAHCSSDTRSGVYQCLCMPDYFDFEGECGALNSGIVINVLY